MLVMDHKIEDKLLTLIARAGREIRFVASFVENIPFRMFQNLFAIIKVIIFN